MRKLSKARKTRILKLIKGSVEQLQVAASEFGQYAVEIPKVDYDKIVLCLESTEFQASIFLKIVDKR